VFLETSSYLDKKGNLFIIAKYIKNNIEFNKENDKEL